MTKLGMLAQVCTIHTHTQTHTQMVELMSFHFQLGRWFAIHQIKGIVTCMIRNYEMTTVKPGKIEYKKVLIV